MNFCLPSNISFYFKNSGVVFSFNTNSDSSKPFKFEAKSTDDLSNKLDIAGTTVKSQLPVRKSTNRRIRSTHKD